jgi:hypothetical protein
MRYMQGCTQHCVPAALQPKEDIKLYRIGNTVIVDVALSKQVSVPFTSQTSSSHCHVKKYAVP